MAAREKKLLQIWVEVFTYENNMDIQSIFKKLSPSKSSGIKPFQHAGATPVLALSIATAVVLLADAWFAQPAIKAIYQYKFTDVGARQIQSTRINFDGYKKALDRIDAAATYKPPRDAIASPFRAVTRATDQTK